MTDTLPAYEKLGVFYLGRPVDPATGETAPVPFLYDSKDLVTHALLVGMTGSGKTGLGIGLLEEAALDGVPALVIDPKGDLGNLLLTFPDLRGADFEPWVDPEAARREGVSRSELAERQAALWRDGLARWDEDGERIRRLRGAADFRVYTPGSSAGYPVSVLASFAAPPAALFDDADLLRDRVATTVASLLGLAGVEADPVRSREHILLALLFESAWREGRDLDLATLIQQVQTPPVDKVGVMPLDTFFPAGERFGLAMALNNLLASPGFAAWLEGEPLDVDRLLYTAQGRPRVAIFNLAHLSEAERMFFVSLLVSQVVGWVRGLPGTGSLRALLYMDEVFGFLPPVAEPPSKKPLLTLLKQGRAYGCGVVLATQNPVDLDYKGLSNIGTWFLGRLQTQRDKDRLLDGLEGAGGASDRAELDRLLSSLDKRVFLAHNVHEDSPVLFRTRWAMSYLAGPLSRDQVRRLREWGEAAGEAPEDEAGAGSATGSAAVGGAGGTAAGSSAGVAPAAAGGAGSPSGIAGSTLAAASASRPSASSAAGVSESTSAGNAALRPVLPPEVPQAFLVPVGGGSGAVYRPHLLGLARVHFVDDKRGIRHAEDLAWLAAVSTPAGPDWHAAEPLDLDPDRDLLPEPLPGAAAYDDPPAAATDPRRFKAWEKDLADALYRSRRLDLPAVEELGMVARPGESERDFRIRLADAAREERDRRLEALRERYAKKIESQGERVRRGEVKVAQEAEQAEDRKRQAWLHAGSSLLGALLGRKKLSVTNARRVSSALSGFSRSNKEEADVALATETLERERQALAALEAELDQEAKALGDKYDPDSLPLGTLTLKPRRADIEIRRFLLAWVPDP